MFATSSVKYASVVQSPQLVRMIRRHSFKLCMIRAIVILLSMLACHGFSLRSIHRLRSGVLGSAAIREKVACRSLASTMEAKTPEAVITPRNVDYAAWYNDVIFAADMVDHSPVRGCMVIKPWGMGIWDLLRTDLDNRIRAIGANNAYFPLFIPQSFLSKEAEHVDGFAKECAVVTHHRLCVDPDNPKQLIPDPQAKLEEPLIVRPTSETVIWSMLKKWIKSHRDLPMKLNQWANVVRWEMRTRPFLRSSEFLWQEGHTAHATEECARQTVVEALDLYADTCEQMLAMPTIKGAKSPSERFAGAEDTYTIEAMMQNGWALQSGTSHFLGQNFARAFDVHFQNASEGRELVWATSWGVSTRLLGAMVMTHSDDKGLVLPPRVAPVQVAIVPIMKGPQAGAEHDAVVAKAEELAAALRAVNVRVKVDTRYELRPGVKYFEWERKGLPLRIDLGARDLLKHSAVLSLRHTGAKASIDISSPGAFAQSIQKQLNNMHDQLLEAAVERLTARTMRVDSYAEMRDLLLADRGAVDGEASAESDASAGSGTLASDARPAFFLAPWKCDAANEAAIKEECKATIRCYPFASNQQPPAPGVKCFYSGEQATHMALFARAY